MKMFITALIRNSSTASASPNSIKEYLQSPCLPQEEDPLEFWRNYEA